MSESLDPAEIELLDNMLEQIELLVTEHPTLPLAELIPLCPFVQAQLALQPALLPKLERQFTDLQSIDQLLSRGRRAPNAYPAVAGFQILGILGYGGMGVVYRALQLSLNRDVALKIMLSGRFASQRTRDRFLQEARLAGRLHHPNIAQIYDSGEAEGLPYLSQELLAGGNLSERIATRPLSVTESAELAEQLATAVHYAHQNGIIHRDLKPSNVLLSKTGVPKIVDFGMAKALDFESGLTRTGESPGTPSYMAPEQASGQPTGAPTDVYGLGAILYELLTSHPPFAGASNVDTLRQVLTDEPQRPRQLQKDLPHDLQAICLKCLEKDPQRRYATAGDLAEDLRRFLANEPVRARFPSAFERLQKWSRRRPATAALIAVTIVAATTILSGTVWHSVRLRRALVETEQQRLAAETHKQKAEKSAREAARQNEANSQYLYSARMRLAYQSFDQGETRQVASLLAMYDDGQPSSGLRGFEWHYLRRALDGARLVLRGHRGEVYGVAFSPDGRLLVSGGEDGTIRLWDPVTGEQLRMIAAHGACTNDLAFAPDGSYLASTSCDGTTKLWDTATWQELRVFKSEEKIIACVEFSPDGRWLATGARDRAMVRVWDVATAQQVASLGPFGGAFDGVAWSPDGKLLAASNIVAGMQLWDTSDWKEQSSPPVSQSTSVAFLSDSKRVIGGSSKEDNLGLWDSLSGERTTAFGHHYGRIEKVVLTGDGRLAISCGSDMVRTWVLDQDNPPTNTGHSQAQKSPKGQMLVGHEGRVQDLAISPDDCLLASAGFDGTVRVWDLEQRDVSVPALRVPIGDSLGISSDRLALSSDLSRVSVLHGNGPTVVEWDVASGEHLGEPAKSPPGDWNWVLSRNGEKVAGFNNREDVVLIGEAGQPLKLETWYTIRPLFFQFSDDGQYATVAGSDGWVRVWNVDRRRECYAEQFVKTNQAVEWNTMVVMRMALSDDGNTLAILGSVVAPRDAVVDLVTRRRTPLPNLKNPARSTSFSGSGDLLVMTDYLGTVEIIDARTGRTRHTLVNSTQVSATAFSPDGHTFVTGTADGTVKLWQTVTGQELTTFNVGNSPIRNLQFSADGRKLGAIAVDEKALEASLYVWSAESK